MLDLGQVLGGFWKMTQKIYKSIENLSNVKALDKKGAFIFPFIYIEVDVGDNFLYMKEDHVCHDAAIFLHVKSNQMVSMFLKSLE